MTDTLWHLESLVAGSGAVESPAAPAGLTIEGDGTLTGSTGCRALSGEWIEDGDEILFDALRADGSCPADVREQDGRVVGVLGDGFTVVITGQQMELSSEGGYGLIYSTAG